MPGGSPIGAAVHAVVDAVTGHSTHHDVPEMVDPLAEETYWREHHREQPFARADRSFEDYALAYHVGFTGHLPERTFAERETELRAMYEAGPNGPQILPWSEVRDAARAAYERVSRGEAYRFESNIAGTNESLH